MSQADKQRHRLKTIGKVWSEWESIPVTEKMREDHKYLRNVHSVFRNSRYSVHMFACTTTLGAVMQVDVMPHLIKREIPWEDMQRIKAELFSPDAVALEVYPAAAIDMRIDSNVRIMWVMPVDWELPFGLHLPTAFGGQA